MTYKTILVTPTYTLLDDTDLPSPRAARSTPADTWSQGLGALLCRIERSMDTEGVLLLDPRAARALGLGATETEQATMIDGLNDAMSAGWKVGRPGAFTTFYADGRATVYVGVTSMLDAARVPLVNPTWHHDTVYAMSMWHGLTGGAWHGTPGVAGLVLLRKHAPMLPVKDGRKAKPAWKGTPAPETVTEQAWGRAWVAASVESRYVHGYDARRCYLAAAQGCESLAPWSLRSTGRIAFSPKLAGWWKIELGSWNDPRIPAPAGPGRAVRWVTTPTLALLAELADAGGATQTFEVLDSRTGAGRRLLRRWAERMESTRAQAAALAAGEGEAADDAARVLRATKAAYSEAWGMLNRPGSAVYRPDWHFAILAQARCNLWRKMWRAGMAEGRWPVKVSKTDSVWYGSDLADPVPAAPGAFAIGTGMGQFGVKQTVEVAS